MAMVAKTVSGNLSCSFYATLDCMGQTFASHIAGHPVAVSMPVLDTKDKRMRIAPPSMTGIYLDDSEAESMSRGYGWGSLDWQEPPDIAAITLGTIKLDVARISKLGITTEIRANDLRKSTMLRKMDRASDQWWTAVTSWIEVLSRQHITRMGPEHKALSIFPMDRDKLRALIAYRISLFNESSSMTREERLERLAVEFRAARSDITGIIDLAQLRASFLLAGRGEMPPDEWLFIRDARSLYRAGEYRRAVIDVGSAAELAIMRIIQDKLTRQHKTAAYIERQLVRAANYPLGRKKTLFETELNLGRLPPNFQPIVIDKRNDAVHVKAEIRQIDAKRAIAKTQKLVERAIPLSSLMPP
jgi:hypothetical protein